MHQPHAVWDLTRQARTTHGQDGGESSMTYRTGLAGIHFASSLGLTKGLLGAHNLAAMRLGNGQLPGFARARISRWCQLGPDGSWADADVGAVLLLA